MVRLEQLNCRERECVHGLEALAAEDDIANTASHSLSCLSQNTVILTPRDDITLICSLNDCGAIT